jgi:4-amino-4-deoxy-L-arabinose transferase-like glycosyltransferase
MALASPPRPRSTLYAILLLWIAFYASFTLFAPPLLDDADSVHAEVAREMLLRHDCITLYANGIRYLEKAPLLYWAMALSFKLFGVSTAAARLPLALAVLALAFTVETFARRAYRGARAGLYAALILLSSFGLFLFTRINIPDALVCLWLTLALLCFYLTEQLDPPQSPKPPNPASPSPEPPNQMPHPSPAHRKGWVAFFSPSTKDGVPHPSRSYRDGWDVGLLCYAFAAACALNVLTKGLIGLIFPVAIVLIYLPLTRGPRATVARLRQLHPLSSLAVFLAIAAPWHILIALANPDQGHPGALTFTHGHIAVPLPTDGNVHGWLWFYFVNEQLLRYLNLRVPHDYDTVPLWLFWGLCLVWLLPWSAFSFKALAQFLPSFPRPKNKSRHAERSDSRTMRIAQPKDPDTLHAAPNAHTVQPTHSPQLILILWAAIPLLFFSLSTRQEYYVLPALPALAILIAGWLTQPQTDETHRANLRITLVLLILGALFAAAVLLFLAHTRAPAPNTDLAQLLQQNPADYALSLGHFLDLNASALGLFRLPLALAAAGVFLPPLASFFLRKKAKPHAANLALAAGAITFLLAAHLGLKTFARVLSSQQLAAAIAPQLKPTDLIVIHQEYEFASTLGFYLRRPSYSMENGHLIPINPIHILEGRSSNLWYGSFFPDAPQIFETPQSIAQEWPGPQRIFLWQDLANQPSPLPALPGPIYVIAKSGGKEIVSNQPNHP